MDFNCRVLVIGDIIRDIQRNCSTVGLSLESPTMKTQFENIKENLGGSANVVLNLLELGANVDYISVINKNDRDLYKKISSTSKKCNFSPIYSSKFNTTSKERIWISRGNQTYKYLQINSKPNTNISTNLCNKILKKVMEKINNVDIVLVVDYRTGIFTEYLINSILEICKNHKVKVISSSQLSKGDKAKKSNHYLYRNYDLVVMNEEEYNANNNISFKNDPIITLGSRGSKIGNNIVPSFKVDEIDPTGAGDSFLSCVSLCYNKNISPIKALKISNKWASLAIKEIGTTVPKFKEL